MLILATAAITKMAAKRFDAFRRRPEDAQEPGSRETLFDLDHLGSNDSARDHERNEHNKILEARDAFAAERNVADRQRQGVADSGTHDSSLERCVLARK